MKGVLFNVVEEVVTERFGPELWDELLDAAGIDGAYTALGQYDDGELDALVAVAATTLGVEPEDVLRLVGRAGFARLAGRYPYLLGGFDSAFEVLQGLNDVIHPQVLALYPGATVPSFEVVELTDDGARIELRYRSERGLCHLAEGLASGLADSFGHEVTVAQPTCRHRGDDECRLVVEVVGRA